MENLEETGTFKGIGRALEEHFDEQGLLEASIEATYVPMAGAGPAAAPPAAAPAAEGSKQP
ncbi:hypothetical protein D3C83_163000 [compost metagenome]